MVRAEEQTEIEQEALQTVNGGNVEEAATDGEKQENGGNEGETETTDVLVAEVKDRKQVYEKEIAFDSSSDWSDQGEFEIGITTEEALHNGAYLTMDVLVPDNVKFSNYMKVQGIAKVGDEWTWTEAGNIPELTIDSFGEVVDGYRRATIRFDFGGNIENSVITKETYILRMSDCTTSRHPVSSLHSRRSLLFPRRIPASSIILKMASVQTGSMAAVGSMTTALQTLWPIIMVPK